MKKDYRTMYVTIYNHKLKVVLDCNSSVSAIIEILKQGDITFIADDYGQFEKVGDLGFTLPTNDHFIEVSSGDVILYQGRNICLYYGTNSWNFTKLGRIEGYSIKELKKLLGAGHGKVEVTLSLD